MEEKAAPLIKIAHAMIAVWPWIALAVGLLTLVLIITPLGIWMSLMRRNKLMTEVLDALRYQNEVLKWLGNQTKKDGDPGMGGGK